MSSAVKVMITVAVALGGVGVLIYSSLADTDYYKKVHEVMVEPDQWTDKGMRVHGWVEAGSIDENIVGQKTKRTFVLESEGHRIMVRSEGPKPDTFRDLAEVVAKGRLVKEGDAYVLHATELMAKCPSKYEEDRINKGQNEFAPGAEASDSKPSGKLPQAGGSY